MYTPTEEDLKRLKANFTHHPPTGTQLARYESIRNSARAMANLILVSCPPSRERSLALTRLEEAMMWSNASIARGE